MCIAFDPIQYSTIQYNTIQYSTIQYSTVQCSAVQYSTIQCNVACVIHVCVLKLVVSRCGSISGGHQACIYIFCNTYVCLLESHVYKLFHSFNTIQYNNPLLNQNHRGQLHDALAPD